MHVVVLLFMPIIIFVSGHWGYKKIKRWRLRKERNNRSIEKSIDNIGIE
jgi:hypothetical protein